MTTTTEALEYNRSQNFHPGEIQMIDAVARSLDRAVDAKQAWDESLVESVGAWQAAQGISSPDGRVYRGAGGDTFHAMETALAQRLGTRFFERRPAWDVWFWFSSHEGREQLVDAIDLGAGGIRVLYNSMSRSTPPVFERDFSDETIAELFELARSNRLTCSLSLFPYKDPKYLDAFQTSFARSLTQIGPVDRLEFDVEENWTDYAPKDSERATAAAASWVSALSGYDLSATTYPDAVENGTHATFASRVARLTPQGYVGKPSVGWNAATAPGSVQRLALDHATRVPRPAGVQRIYECGLALSSENWGDHSASTALAVSYNAALAWGVERVSFWRANDLSASTGVIREFLESIRPS